MYIYCFVLFGVIGDGLFFLISTTTPVLKGRNHFLYNMEENSQN